MKKFFLIALSFVFLLSCTTSRKSNKQTSGNQDSEKSANDITNKYWKLVKLEGKNVTMAKNQERETYFTLKPDGMQVTGFSGCNSFNGVYTLEAGWRIRFSQMASTLKACPDVNVDEREFLKVFELTDNYTLTGDTLSLNVGRRAPLAVFTAVYFK